LDISVYSNGTTSLPFRPFTLFFSASCPTVDDCPISPSVTGQSLLTPGSATPPCSGTPATTKYILLDSGGFPMRVFNDSGATQPFDGNRLYYLYATNSSYRIDDNGFIIESYYCGTPGPNP
jgi:hypothetical protein